MKKSKKASLLVILALVALFSCVLVFSLLVSAEGENEATLITETVNRDADGKITGTTQTATKAGSYQALIGDLANLDPASETRYTIKLAADAVQTAAVSLNIGANAEVRIELDGHKLQSSLSGAAITLSGTGVFRIDGGYNALGECGVLASTGADEFLKIEAGASVRADLKNLDISYLGSSFVNALGGEATLRESYVAFAGESANAVVKASDATVSIKYVDVDASDATTVIYLSGAKGYIEGGYVYAGTLIESDDRVSSTLVVSVDAENVTSFKVGNADSKTYVLGSKLDISATLATGLASAENLVFYYGDGSMRLSGAGADPSAYGIQSKCAFTENEGVYTMSTSSSYDAMSTTATLGEAPVVKSHTSYIKGLGTDGVSRAINSSVTAPTIGINVLLKDAVVASSVTITGNEYTSLIIDLNGKTLHWSATTVKNFSYSGNLHYTFDGADVDGTKGTMRSDSNSLMLFYPRQSSSTGVNNEQTVTRITNAEMLLTNMGGASSDAFININSGDVFVSDVSITYTGEKLTDATTSTSAYVFVFDHDFGPSVNAHLNNVTVKNTYAGTDRIMNVIAFSTRVTARVWCNNFTTEGIYSASYGAAAASVTLIDSNVSVTGQVFSTVTGHLYDTAIVVPTGKLATSGTGKVYVHITEENKTSIDTAGNSLIGTWVTEQDDYVLVPDASGVYHLTDGIDKPKPITLSKIFANGMVFQRNKTINVFGYCEDTNAELKITLGDRVGTASVDENGEWYCELEPMEAAWDLTLTIEQTNHVIENMIQFTNVAVGEVWVVSGQSNAQFSSAYLEDLAEIAVMAETVKNVRTYKSTASYTFHPSKYGSGNWYTNITPSYVKTTSASTGFSAIGLATAFRLAAELGPDVPVAVIQAARGGSPIVGWLSYETLQELSPSEAKKYEDYVAKGVLDDAGRTTYGCCLYNHQVAPYEGYEVAGVMWYQGCSDLTSSKLGTEGKTYTDFFKALEHDYRRVYGNDDNLPFYVMQLAPYQSDVSELASFKAQQYDFCAELDNTYLVTTTTEGATLSDTLFSQGFIHPSRKTPVANRCTDMILANEYGIKYNDVYAHANVVSVTASGSTLTVAFDSELKLLFGDTVLGFDVSADGTTWKKATGVIDGNKVILTSELASPKYVRYAYSEIMAELGDGTIVSAQTAKNNSTSKTMTITSGDKTYVLSDCNDLIRTMDYGNLTNASGAPTPVFILGLTE